MAFDLGNFGEYTDGFADFAQQYGDLAGDWGNYGEYSGGFGDFAESVPNLAAGYDLISNPNSLQVPSDDTKEYDESPLSIFGKSIKSDGAKTLAGLFGIPGKIAYGALTQDRSMIPSMFGSMVGNAILPGFGGMIGSYLGGKVDMPTYSGPLSENPGVNGSDIAGTLLQLYGMSKANAGLDGANDMNSALSAQVRNLADMYGPNSPYAAQLRQTLERKDAAAGRRSQYGPREAQLQAMLAEKATQATSAMASAAQAGNANALAMNKYKNQLTGQKLALAANMAKKFGLFDIFNKPSVPYSPALNPALGLFTSLVPGNMGSTGNPLFDFLD